MAIETKVNPSTGNLDLVGIASLTIGTLVVGGDPDEVLYIDSTNAVNSHPNFKFDGANVVLKAGVKLIFDGA